MSGGHFPASLNAASGAVGTLEKTQQFQEGAALKASSHGASLHIPSAYSGSVPILQMRKWFHKKLLGFTEFLDTSSCVCLK